MGNYLVIIGVIAASVVIVIAVVAVILNRPSNREPSKAANPDAVLSTAWDHYVTHPDKWSARDRRVIDRVARLDGETSKHLADSLGETVEQALAAPNPQAALRKAVMDATDRFVMADSLTGADRDRAESEMSDEEFEGSLEAGILRCFAMLRFRDFAKDDWYAHYLSVAEMNCKNVASMVQKTVRGEQSSLETSLHDSLSHTMRQVRQALLHYPSQKPVTRSDRLTTDDAAPRAFPSQHEIDQLTNVMRLRFEKLFSGQMYRVENGAPVNPVDAFQVDAALLYTVLSLYYRRHEDAWRKIMDEALGSHKEAMADEAKLLEMGREFKVVWVKNEQGGPLRQVLETAARTFERPAAAGSAEPTIVANRMIEDAGFLVRSIREIIGPK